jgi:GATA-binding protein
MGSVLCNACGLFLKLHGRPRPISLKTDVIKSRNRVKTATGPKKKVSTIVLLVYSYRNKLTRQQPSLESTGFHHDVNPSHSAYPPRRHSDRMSSGEHHRSPSPTSRNTPSLVAHHNPNIAPQHIFDNVSLAESSFQPAGLPTFALRQPSPAHSVNAMHPEHAHPYSENHISLKTRVSELEVINDLFRGRVAELEQSEQDAREKEAAARNAADQYKADLDAALVRESALKRTIEALDAEIESFKSQGAPSAKRLRLSDVVRDDSPTSHDPLPAASIAPDSKAA